MNPGVRGTKEQTDPRWRLPSLNLSRRDRVELEALWFNTNEARQPEGWADADHAARSRWGVRWAVRVLGLASTV
jgi:hypothetical protein